MPPPEAVQAAASTPPDWATLTLDLYCPRCGYNLRMLTGSRCPECGLELDWQRIIASVERRGESPLFEYRWRERPLRSYFSTLCFCMRPWRLWTSLSKEDEPSTGALVVLAIAILLPYFVISALLYGAVEARYLSAVGRSPRWDLILFWPARRQLVSIGFHAAAIASIWLFLRFLQRTLSIYRIRSAHLLRVAVLSYIPVVVVKILNDLAVAGVTVSGMPSNLFIATYVLLEAVGLVALLVSLYWALDSYLRISRSRFMAAAVFAMTELFWTTLLLYSSSFPAAHGAMNSNWPSILPRVAILLSK